MHDDFQEPYLGKLEHFPRMGLVDRHDPEWLSFNEDRLTVALKDHQDELKSAKKQYIDWLVAGNAGGIALLMTFISSRAQALPAILFLIPSFIAYLFALIGAWGAVYYWAQESEAWIQFYTRHMRYAHALKLYGHSKPEIAIHWRKANLMSEEILIKSTLSKRGVLVSLFGFTFGTCNFFAYIVFFHVR